jgi:hypothetical protein
MIISTGTVPSVANKIFKVVNARKASVTLVKLATCTGRLSFGSR